MSIVLPSRKRPAEEAPEGAPGPKRLPTYIPFHEEMKMKRELYADIDVTVDGRHFWVSKLLLAQFSSLFGPIFKSEIPAPQISSECFELLINILYYLNNHRTKPEVSEDQVLDIIAAVKDFQCDERVISFVGGVILNGTILTLPILEQMLEWKYEIGVLAAFYLKKEVKPLPRESLTEGPFLHALLARDYSSDPSSFVNKVLDVLILSTRPISEMLKGRRWDRSALRIFTQSRDNISSARIEMMTDIIGKLCNGQEIFTTSDPKTAPQMVIGWSGNSNGYPPHARMISK